jgi:hypothetical protein
MVEADTVYGVGSTKIGAILNASPEFIQAVWNT